MVDLRECEYGDLLISKHGALLMYLEPLEESDYFDHRVKYLIVDGKTNIEEKWGTGTRTHDGFVFRKKRLETDHDIVKIIKKEDFTDILKSLI